MTVRMVNLIQSYISNGMVWEIEDEDCQNGNIDTIIHFKHGRDTDKELLMLPVRYKKRVYGQFCIEALRGRRKRKRKFNGSVLFTNLYRKTKCRNY